MLTNPGDGNTPDYKITTGLNTLRIVRSVTDGLQEFGAEIASAYNQTTGIFALSNLGRIAPPFWWGGDPKDAQMSGLWFTYALGIMQGGNVDGFKFGRLTLPETLTSNAAILSGVIVNGEPFANSEPALILVDEEGTKVAIPSRAKLVVDQTAGVSASASNLSTPVYQASANGIKHDANEDPYMRKVSDLFDIVRLDPTATPDVSTNYRLALFMDSVNSGDYRDGRIGNGVSGIGSLRNVFCYRHASRANGSGIAIKTTAQYWNGEDTKGGAFQYTSGIDALLHGDFSFPEQAQAVEGKFTYFSGIPGWRITVPTDVVIGEASGSIDGYRAVVRPGDTAAYLRDTFKVTSGGGIFSIRASGRLTDNINTARLNTLFNVFSGSTVGAPVVALNVASGYGYDTKPYRLVSFFRKAVHTGGTNSSGLGLVWDTVSGLAGSGAGGLAYTSYRQGKYNTHGAASGMGSGQNFTPPLVTPNDRGPTLRDETAIGRFDFYESGSKFWFAPMVPLRNMRPIVFSVRTVGEYGSTLRSGFYAYLATLQLGEDGRVPLTGSTATNLEVWNVGTDKDVLLSGQRVAAWWMPGVGSGPTSTISPGGRYVCCIDGQHIGTSDGTKKWKIGVDSAGVVVTTSAP